VNEILRATEHGGDGNHEHVNEFVAPPPLSARVGELQQVMFQGGSGCVLHPQFQPHLNAFGNL